MAYALTFCLTLGGGLFLLALFRSRSSSEDAARPKEAPSGAALQTHEERATEIAETLAIEKANDVAWPALPAGTLLPTAYSETFSTVDYGQKAVQLRLLAGASKKASACRTLLTLNVSLEHPGSPGKPKVKLVLRVTEDGSLTVHAHEQGARRPVEPAGLRVAVQPSDRKRPRAWSVSQRRILVASIKYGYFAYVLYSDVDQSGLTGWIASLSMRLFHASWDIPNVLLGWALYFPGAWLMGRGLNFIRPGTIFPPAAKPVAAPSRSLPNPPVPAWIGLGIGLVTLAVCIGSMAGLVAFHARTSEAQHQAAAPALNLDSFSRTPPASPRVELEGWFHEQLTASYESAFAPSRVTVTSVGGIEGSDHAFTPVTSTHWTLGEPVSFLLERSVETPVADRFLLGRSIHWKPGQDPGSLTRRTSTDAPPPQLATTRNVRLEANDLPLFVRDAYERAGIRFTDPYWVAYPDEDERPFLLALIGVFVVACFGVPVVGMRLARRVQRRRAG